MDLLDSALLIVRAVVRGRGNAPETVTAARELLEAEARRQAVERERAAYRAAEEARREARRQALAGYEVAPQIERGVDHSGLGRVLLRRASDNRRLVWRAGRSFTYGVGLRDYAPPELQILGKSALAEDLTDNRRYRKETGRAERLSPDILTRHREEIDGAFGAGATDRALEALKTKRTVVL